MEGNISATVQSKITSGILYAVPVFHLQKDLKKLEQVQKCAAEVVIRKELLCGRRPKELALFILVKKVRGDIIGF